MQAQKVERGQGRQTLLIFAPTTPAWTAPVNDALWSCDGDVDGANGLAFLHLRSRHPRDAQTVIRFEQSAHSTGHGARCFGADHPELLNGLARHTHLGFAVAVIGHDPATKMSAT